MINLDVGFVLQLGSLLVFIPMMDRLIFRKVRAVTQERASRLEGAEEQAREASRRADDLARQREATIDASRREGISQGQASLEASRAEGERRLEERFQAAEADLREARARFMKEAEVARPELLDRVDDLARLLARQMVEGRPS